MHPCHPRAKILAEIMLYWGMELFYDFELDNSNKSFTPNQKLLHSEIRDFINQRYSVLDDEIKMSQDLDNPSYAVLIFAEEGFQILFFNIEVHLIEKLKDCVTDDDMNYINLKCLKERGLA